MILWRDALSVSSDVLSVFGFGISLYVFYSVKDIRRRMLFRGTVPKLYKSLESNASELSQLLSDFTNSHTEIRGVFSKLEGDLLNLKGKLTGELKSKCKSFLKRIRQARGKVANTEAEVRALYEDLLLINQLLKNHLKDDQWR